MWLKTAQALGSGTVDPTQSEGAVTTTAPVVVGNKPAPGQTGPKGLAPRTTYSRSNSGEVPVPQLGETAKATPPRGMEFLPKVGHQEIPAMQYSTRFTVQDLVKSAMAGTQENLSRSLLADAPAQAVQTKVASAAHVDEAYTTESIEKFASALDYLAKEAETGDSVGVGKGPGHLEVLEVQSTSENQIKPNQGGQAVAADQPPKNPSLAKLPEGNAAPTLETNINQDGAPYPENTLGNESAPIAAQKQASAAGNLAVLKKLAGVSLAKSNLAVLQKIAEDAINPAQITAGKASRTGAEAPEGVSESGEGPVPAVPSDVTSQNRLIASNEAAINYNKREAKADPKKDLNTLLVQPAQTTEGDRILEQAFDHTAASGAKIASAKTEEPSIERVSMTKAAAAKALLIKMASEVGADAAKKKEKQATMAGAGTLSTPAGQSGFTAATL